MYVVPVSKKTMFEFEISGKKFSLPRFKHLPIGTIEELDSTPEKEQLQMFMELFGSKTSPMGKAVRALDVDQFMGLFHAWQADSDITVGESSPS